MPDSHDDIAPHLEVDELSLDGGIRVIALTGEFDVATVEHFDAALDRAVASATQACVADLTRLTFIDSSGLAALLGALRRLERTGGRLLVACANPTVLRLFEITGTNSTFEVSATREQAIELARHQGKGAAA